MSRMRGVLLSILLLLVGLSGGCAANRPATWLITGEGRAPIAGAESRQRASSEATAPVSVPWARRTLRASAVAPIELEPESPPGAPYAGAILKARGEARADLRRQTEELPATADRTLVTFAAEVPPAARAVEASLQAAREDLRVDWEARQVSVALELPLSGLASAVLSCGGGVLPRVEAEPRVEEGQALVAAQREAVRRARASLIEQLQVVPLNRDLRLGDKMGSEAILADAVMRGIRGARTLRSEELPSGEWIVVLELDVVPLLDVADSLPEKRTR